MGPIPLVEPIQGSLVRAIQSDRNHIEIQLEFLDSAEARFDAEGFVQRLRAVGLPEGVRIDVESVLGLLPDPPTGKFRRMISQVGPPQIESCSLPAAP
jgi:hypothetical protein